MNCTGLAGHSTFIYPNPVEFNVSNSRIVQSLQLNRSLMDQEQLDLSLASNLSSWYANKDQYSSHSASCNIFLKTFTALDNVTTCINVPKFTCHRFWTNNGL